MYDSPKNSTSIQFKYENLNSFESPMAPQKGFRSKLENSEFSPPNFKIEQSNFDDRPKIIIQRKIISGPFSNNGHSTGPSTKPFSISSWNIDSEMITPQKCIQNIHSVCEAPEKQ
jgi:hypothetical protein